MHKNKKEVHLAVHVYVSTADIQTHLLMYYAYSHESGEKMSKEQEINFGIQWQKYARVRYRIGAGESGDEGEGRGEALAHAVH